MESQGNMPGCSGPDRCAERAFRADERCGSRIADRESIFQRPMPTASPTYPESPSMHGAPDVPASAPTADVSVVIVNYNTAHLLEQLRESLDAARGSLSLQIIIVDNASRDDSLARLKRVFPDAHVIANPVNVGFGRANNQALPLVQGRYVLLLNTDAFVSADTLQRTVAHLDSHPRCGVVGVRLVGRDGQAQPDCRNFPTPWNVFLTRAGLHRLFPKVALIDDPQLDRSSTRDCDWVPGCYLLTRREVVARLGLFDPRYFLYYEEVDFCLRVKRDGWHVTYLPSTSVVHIGGESAKSEGALTSSGSQLSALQVESELLYFRKHYGRAGLAAFIVLSWLTDTIHAVKWIVRGQRTLGLAAIRRHSGLLLTLLRKTRLGTVPTR